MSDVRVVTGSRRIARTTTTGPWLRKLVHHDLRMSRESALTTRSRAAGSGRSGPAMTARVFVCRNLRPTPKCEVNGPVSDPGGRAVDRLAAVWQQDGPAQSAMCCHRGPVPVSPGGVSPAVLNGFHADAWPAAGVWASVPRRRVTVQRGPEDPVSRPARTSRMGRRPPARSGGG